MNDELQQMITRSTFQVIGNDFVYTKVKELPGDGAHFMVTKDEDEITVVTKQGNIEKLAVLERNKDTYALISLNVSVPFYSVGFLATVSSSVASEGMNILIVSTYSKDYIMVREDNLEKTKKVLLNLGFKEKI